MFLVVTEPRPMLSITCVYCDCQSTWPIIWCPYEFCGALSNCKSDVLSIYLKNFEGKQNYILGIILTLLSFHTLWILEVFCWNHPFTFFPTSWFPSKIPPLPTTKKWRARLWDIVWRASSSPTNSQNEAMGNPVELGKLYTSNCTREREREILHHSQIFEV